jgi:hypothetical protein
VRRASAAAMRETRGRRRITPEGPRVHPRPRP